MPLLLSRPEIGSVCTRKAISMDRDFENCVTMYGLLKDIDVAKKAFDELCEGVKAEDEYIPELRSVWTLSENLRAVRLEPFRTQPCFYLPHVYLPELSEKHPTVVFEWSHFTFSHDFYCSVFKNGRMLSKFEARVGPDDKDFFEEYYYLKSQRFAEPAQAKASLPLHISADASNA
jgi:hypothetical protein